VLRILNVTPAKEAGITAGVPNYFENTGSNRIKYKRVSVYDTTTSDLLPYADEIVQFISNGLHHGSVLVHCQRGVSRSATALIMFLMRKANMTLNQSLILCQRRRPMVDPNPAFLDQLRTYERECWAGGHLTSMDVKQHVVKAKGIESLVDAVGNNVFDKWDCVKDNTEHGDGGGKRKSEDSGFVVGRKKTSSGPIWPLRGPVRSAATGAMRGPVKSAAIGPLRGPVKTAAPGPLRGPVKTAPPGPTRAPAKTAAIGPRGGLVQTAAIGPAVRPFIDISCEQTESGRGINVGGNPLLAADGKVPVSERKKQEERISGPMRRPSI